LSHYKLKIVVYVFSFMKKRNKRLVKIVGGSTKAVQLLLNENFILPFLAGVLTYFKIIN